jgi:hypothetical protein
MKDGRDQETRFLRGALSMRDCGKDPGSKYGW